MSIIQKHYIEQQEQQSMYEAESDQWREKAQRAWKRKEIAERSYERYTKKAEAVKYPHVLNRVNALVRELCEETVLSKCPNAVFDPADRTFGISCNFYVSYNIPADPNQERFNNTEWVAYGWFWTNKDFASVITPLLKTNYDRNTIGGMNHMGHQSVCITDLTDEEFVQSFMLVNEEREQFWKEYCDRKGLFYIKK